VAEVKKKVETMNLYSKEESEDEEMPDTIIDSKPLPPPSKTVEDSSDDEVLVPDSQMPPQEDKENEKPKKEKKQKEIPKDQPKMTQFTHKEAKSETPGKEIRVRKVKKEIEFIDEDGFQVTREEMVDEEYEVETTPTREVSSSCHTSAAKVGPKTQGTLSGFLKRGKV